MLASLLFLFCLTSCFPRFSILSFLRNPIVYRTLILTRPETLINRAENYAASSRTFCWFSCFFPLPNLSTFLKGRNTLSLRVELNRTTLNSRREILGFNFQHMTLANARQRTYTRSNNHADSVWDHSHTVDTAVQDSNHQPSPRTYGQMRDNVCNILES